MLKLKKTTFDEFFTPLDIYADEHFKPAVLEAITSNNAIFDMIQWRITPE